MGDVYAPVYDFDAALEYLGEADAAEVFQREVRSFVDSFIRSFGPSSFSSCLVAVCLPDRPQ